MNIVVCCKVVPDDQDIQVAADGTLDYSKAKPIVSAYDLNAIEAAAQLADGGRVVAVTAGPADIDDSKLKKNILARGVDELYMTADDAVRAALDAHAAAAALADLVAKAGEYDLILCGDGSADDYAQQVDAAGWPRVWGCPPSTARRRSRRAPARSRSSARSRTWWRSSRRRCRASCRSLPTSRCPASPA